MIADTHPLTSRRTHSFTESVIREMSRISREHAAINLAQGFPDFPAPEALKDAACRAIRNDVNQYATTWGSARLREAIAKWYDDRYAMAVDPNAQVTVTCGATEAMAAVFLAIMNPGDEVIIPAPFYENYGPDAILADAQPRFLTLDGPAYRLDPAQVQALIGPRTRAIVLNTPNNPTGRSYSMEELEGIATVCRDAGILAITDEIYECMVYDGSHLPLASLPGMSDRTITVSGISKTFSVTGWRVGTVVSPPALTGAIRKVHDFLTVGAPAPLQEAAAYAYSEMEPRYFTGLLDGYRERRDLMVEGLRQLGFRCATPEGAYYLLADFSALSDRDDRGFAEELARSAKVAPVPGNSFFHDPEGGRTIVRFTFCKEIRTLETALTRLRDYLTAGS